MSPAELIRSLDRALDALERRDLEGFIEVVEAHTAADCVFDSAIGSTVGGRTFRGLGGIRGWFAELLETAETAHWRERSYAEIGERAVLFLARFEFVGVTSQVPVATEIGSVFELEDGLCRRITSFTSHAEARARAEAVHAEA